jgi:hypothetical protein
MLVQELVGATHHDPNMMPSSKQSFLATPRGLGNDWPERGLTMVGTARLAKGQAILERLSTQGVEGDIVETGVWRGGASLFLASMLQMRCVALGRYADCNRRVWLYDSFQGLPHSSHADDTDLVQFNQWLAVSMAEVATAFTWRHVTHSVPGAQPPCTVKADTAAVTVRREGHVVFVQGFFNESAPWTVNELSRPDSDAARCVGTDTRPFDKIALLRLDGDMYTSSLEILFELAPLLQVGGYLYNDDYTLAGQALAMTHFRELVGWRSPIVHLGDIASVYFEIDRRACITPAMKRWQASGFRRSALTSVLKQSNPTHCEP